MAVFYSIVFLFERKGSSRFGSDFALWSLGYYYSKAG